MEGWQAQRQIKYEAELDPHFGEEIMALPGGERLLSCIQCGTCSGTCPMSPYMDYTPRRLIAMARAGFKREVLSSFTIWLCASCYACTVECPRQINVTDVMYAMKQKALQQGVYPKRFAIPVLAREFFRVVQAGGRNSEGAVILRLYLKTNPIRLLARLPLGMRLWLRGRLGLSRDRIKRRAELRALLEAVERAAPQELKAA